MQRIVLALLALSLSGTPAAAQRPTPTELLSRDVIGTPGKEITVITVQTFYEDPDDVHVVARNASQTARGRFLVFFVKDKGAPLLVSK